MILSSVCKSVPVFEHNHNSDITSQSATVSSLEFVSKGVSSEKCRFLIKFKLGYVTTNKFYVSTNTVSETLRGEVT